MAAINPAIQIKGRIYLNILAIAFPPTKTNKINNKSAPEKSPINNPDTPTDSEFKLFLTLSMNVAPSSVLKIFVKKEEVIILD
jgi:hypothetical protein